MSAIKNVVIAGASGNVGTIVFDKLVSSGTFNVRVLRRPGSTSTFPAGTDVVDVDFESVEALTSALQGQDAVVASLGPTALGLQNGLIDASIQAGVKRFIPAEFGADMHNANAKLLPVFAGKLQVAEYLEQKAKTSSLTYTFIYNGPFLDWGLHHQFIVESKGFKTTILDGGDNVFSTTTLNSVGDGVIGVLSHPEETKNRAVYLEDFKLTQNEILAVAQKLTPGKEWAVQHRTLDEITAESDAKLAKGEVDQATFIPYLYRGVMDPNYGGNFKTNDNKLLRVTSPAKDYLEKLWAEVLN